MLLNKMLYIIILLVSVHGEEIEDDSGKYQYMEIFRNIPKLFEYFLSRLAEKPEVLEKDDITVFVRSANFNREYGRARRDGSCENLDRPLDNTCTLSDIPIELESLPHPQVKKENEMSIIDSDQSLEKDGSQIKYHIDGKGHEIKRDVHSKVSEFGLFKKMVKNCNTDSNNVKRENIIDSNQLRANTGTPGKRCNLLSKKLNKIKKVNTLIKDFGKKLTKLPKKVRNYRKRYTVAESKLLNVSPEDMEDKVLMVERMLEEYNNRNTKEVN